MTRGLTADELLWLQAVDQLLGKMNKFFADSPSEVTPATLRTLAGQLRTCRAELNRIGVPTARLRPVYLLVDQACTEYDKGARCFTDAADRYSEPGFMDKIDCGYGASGKGGEPLARAAIKGQEIKDAAG